ncbi:hypothetical protein ACOMHN_067021 [Nucella lapillus]
MVPNINTNHRPGHCPTHTRLSHQTRGQCQSPQDAPSTITATTADHWTQADSSGFLPSEFLHTAPTVPPT